MKNKDYVKKSISITLNCILIRMTDLNRIDRSVLYQEFKEWINDYSGNDKCQEILCVRYFKNDRELN